MEINLDYQVCGKMHKTDKVGFHFDNSKDNLILNLTQQTQDKTHKIIEQKLVFRLDGCKK